MQKKTGTNLGHVEKYYECKNNAEISQKEASAKN